MIIYSTPEILRLRFTCTINTPVDFLRVMPGLQQLSVKQPNTQPFAKQGNAAPNDSATVNLKGTDKSINHIRSSAQTSSMPTCPLPRNLHNHGRIPILGSLRTPGASSSPYHPRYFYAQTDGLWRKYEIKPEHRGQRIDFSKIRKGDIIGGYELFEINADEWELKWRPFLVHSVDLHKEKCAVRPITSRSGRRAGTLPQDFRQRTFMGLGVMGDRNSIVIGGLDGTLDDRINAPLLMTPAPGFTLSPESNVNISSLVDLHFEDMAGHLGELFRDDYKRMEERIQLGPKQIQTNHHTSVHAIVSNHLQ
ncbi:hypothetical protein EJ08DRAFT_100381 [Tothia fuscella]|uniref:Uncharacterized protein n=1 Tax=Tothia fuscella TaxID=1048955 RepID=A0A9P4NWA2_9PEZI|nr:hypothetical protein EJ08DRAFT_100381 [Tothia fuscella]